MKSFNRSLVVMAVSVFGSVGALAETYYVDFAGGSNKADGLTMQTAWKHSPGDGNATDSPAGTSLVAGDTVVFRGGVAYNGSIILATAGEPGKPITLDGNTAGTFGQGRAVLDGGRAIRGWKRATSAEEAQGNQRWKEIFIADIDVDLAGNFSHGEFVSHRQAPRDRQAPWQRVILCDGDRRLLPIAQFPKPSDPFYPDLPRDFQSSDQRLDVRADESVIVDKANLAAQDPSYYDGMFVGLHGGNNHVYFGMVKKYDPATKQLHLPPFTLRTYASTKYALYNSVRLIDQPGEWAIAPIGEGKSRIYLLPDRLENDQPANIGYPEYEAGVRVDSAAAHVRVEGFLIQRYASGVTVAGSARNAATRARHVQVAGCEIRFISGHAGIGLNYCDEIIVERNNIHHCPSWTTGVFLNRVNKYEVRGNTLVKNSGSGIRHYECKDGFVRANVILDHFGMHSSAINVYEGCANLVLEDNYIQNTVTLNRNADNIIFRNNVIDGMGRTSNIFAMWGSGQTGGRGIKNVQFLNNTFVNASKSANNAAGIFGQRAGGATSPEGLVIRGNILETVNGDVPGEFEGNIYLRTADAAFMGKDCQVVPDMNSLFVDYAKGDFRRRPGGPAMEAGANLAPPEVK